MKIQHHLHSVVLATTLALSAGAMQTAIADTSDSNQSYDIVNVANWDALNIRSGAGTEYRVINEIPANSTGIKVISDEFDVNGSTWVKINWDGQKGWVNKRYLTLATATVASAPAKTAVTTSDNYVNYAQNTGSNHTHPANRCTRSISHTHAGPSEHKHRYSCKGNGRQQQQVTQKVAQTQTDQSTVKQNYYNPTPVAATTTAPNGDKDIYGNYRRVAVNAGLGNHQHPANECTRSISHSHSGVAGHKHSYSCKAKGRQQQQVVRQRTYYGTSLRHTHGKSQCASAINHSHNGGNKMHRHECPSSRNNAAAGGPHTHPANNMTNATTHSHPYQDKNHSHSYGR